MIPDLFILLATYIMTLFVSLFPDSTGFSNTVHSAATTLGAGVGVLNPLVPIDQLVAILGLIITIEIAIFGFKTFKWVISHIPWVGGKG